MSRRVPRWAARLVWAARGKRRVRLHLVPVDGLETTPSLEGVLAGRWGGHYVLLVPRVVHEEERHTVLAGDVEVPAERVLFVQVLGEGARR